MIRALALAAALAAPAALSTPACAQSEDGPGRLTLSATGEVSAAPDIATVSAGVITRAQTASAALRENADLMEGVFEALEAAGIEEREIQTSSLSVSPVYSRPDRSGQDEPRIIAYEARNTVTAITRDLDDLGAVVDALVENGANDFNGVRFGLEDRQEAEDEARRQALAELSRLVALYEEAGDLDIGGILELREGQAFDRPQMDAIHFAAARLEAATTRVAAGELTVSVTLSAVYEIED